ncbi:MAG: glycosyltransferase family 2 protein [Pseudolabrys sp.]
MTLPACKRACASTPGQAGSHVISPPSMPGTSTYFFRSSPHSACHFRLAALQIISAQRRCKVGGWDPHNVTEDADLGMRLARFGYRSGVIPSSTGRLRMSAAESVSGHAGSRAGCRRGLSICASHTGFPRARIR